MTADELREKYLQFFEKQGHKRIPSAPLVPENDPTALFISAGMQPLVPYFLGQLHPEGKRLVDVQKSLRTDDIDEVGDKTHHTFFEMLGNWSLGDYFKQEAIEWSHEFLTSKEWLGIDKQRLAFSVFAGDEDASFDQESSDKWLSLGVPEERIAKLPKKNNWWGPAGQTGPCGPDTEMFVWTGKSEAPKNFDPDNADWVEVWNDVFMEYNKTADGKFELLQQKNVDTGMGLERMLAVINDIDDNYKTDLFWPIIEQLEQRLGVKYDSDKETTKALRVIADHLKASVFLISDGVEPSNKLQGYVLRRLLRRSAAKAFLIKKNFDSQDFKSLVQVIIGMYPDYFQDIDAEKIVEIISLEIRKFRVTVEKGLKEIEKYPTITGKNAFDLYQTYGFPLELTEELATEKGLTINREEFRKEFTKHQDLSRTASAGMFKGGLQDHSEITTRYHTATHLLHAALRQILGTRVEQRGSNITAERLRFDFSYPEKLTEEQLKKVEDLINQKIQESLLVSREEMGKEEALKSGALGFFVEKYGDRVSVYTIGNFSKEICGGPHVENTKELGTFKIQKEESAGSNLRRIYATLT